MLTASKNHSYTNYDRFNEFENLDSLLKFSTFLNFVILDQVHWIKMSSRMMSKRYVKSETVLITTIHACIDGVFLVLVLVSNKISS